MEPLLRLKPLDSPSPVRVRADREGHPREVLEPPRERSSRDTRSGAARERNRKVAAIQEIWRIDDEWWRRPISRLYYRVVLEGGKTLTLFLDRTDGRWYTHPGG